MDHATTPTPIVTPSRMTTLTPPPTPPTIRPTLSLSSSMSPPPTPNRQRQVIWYQASVVRRSSSAVDEAVDELTEKSKFLLRKRSSVLASTPRTTSSESDQRLDSPMEEDDTEDDGTLAAFHRDEILTGELLGEGTFNSVYEVTGFALNQDNCDPKRRQLVAQDPTRFALKHLKPSLLADTLQFEGAATDLVMEAKYLGALQHPNILRLHGEPLNGTAAINNGVDGYFLLCDRLSETLAGRIERWRNGEATESNTVRRKLSYALQIAQALTYLHEQRICFRDLKPSNIGFHQEDSNKVVLFDFGLCRELPPVAEARPYVYGQQVQPPINDMDGSESSLDMEPPMDESLWTEPEEKVFLMSGAGTQIYMAPEVLIQNRYNLKADVYSWAMTVTELLLLEKPLPHYELNDHVQYVCVEGDRPALEGHPEIPDSLKNLLAWAWEADVSKRCTMAQVCEELPEVMAEVEEEQDCRQVCSWSTRIWQAAARLQDYLFSLVGRALEKVSSLFRRNRRDSRDVTFDLPQDKETTQVSDSSAQEDLTLPESSLSNNSDCVLITPRPAPRLFRSAFFKRKPSSASTTAMTDDEFDDDYADLGMPLTPPYHPKPPMEALVERHNSSASHGTTT